MSSSSSSGAAIGATVSGNDAAPSPALPALTSKTPPRAVPGTGAGSPTASTAGAPTEVGRADSRARTPTGTRAARADSAAWRTHRNPPRARARGTRGAQATSTPVNDRTAKTTVPSSPVKKVRPRVARSGISRYAAGPADSPGSHSWAGSVSGSGRESRVSARLTVTWGRTALVGLTAYDLRGGPSRSTSGPWSRTLRTRRVSEKASTERAVAMCSRRRIQCWTRKAAQTPAITTKMRDEGCMPAR